MTLHFAYGANMNRAIMRRHARDAEPLGAAELAGHRFVITGDGYASVDLALWDPAGPTLVAYATQMMFFAFGV